MVLDLLQPVFVSKRYQLLRILGKGGMGTVYEALDRWNNATVALKHVSSDEHSAVESQLSQDRESERALAHEFRTLMSLRHPHIIHVLDYGFDAHRRPYFTMELLHEGRSILAAGENRPLNEKVHLLLQTLQALIYLHHRGILHRDLKPENIAVIGDKTVKVLDFGLSSGRGSRNSSGTLIYMAPEILRDQPATEGTDLYAFGLIAYQLFAGTYPFSTATPDGLLHAILYEQPRDIEGIPQALMTVIQRLISKNPLHRYASAAETMAALTRSVGLPLPPETHDIREGFLQTAPLVGRQQELAWLEESLFRAVAGQGGGWLIGGESGVGKSRLAHEVRIRALIEGAIVIVGQGVQESNRSYAVWREPLRWLALYSQPSDEDARLLKILVPDIEEILERPVDSGPQLAPYEYEEALTHLILHLILQIDRPVVFIFEDIQWIDNEGLSLIARVSSHLASYPCLIIGTYREDERSDLPGLLFGLDWMPLQRFDQSTIRALSGEILGHWGKDERIVSYLMDNSEGNAFFIIEVIRELAHKAGTFEDIMNVTLPQHLITGGIRTIMQRRLTSVPAADYAILQAAAVAGREIDLDILSCLFPDKPLETWVFRCQQQAILEFDGSGWRFAHDKIRESLLNTMTTEQTRHYHDGIAQALEHLYGDSIAHMAQMAYHWQAAGNDPKTAHYMGQVALEAIRVYAYKQARSALHSALTALRRLPLTPEAIIQRIDLSLKLVTVSFNAAAPQENLDLLEDIRLLIEAHPEAHTTDQLIEIYYALGRTLYYNNQPEPSLIYLRHMSVAAQQIKDTGRDALAVTMMGRVISQQGYFSEALTLLDAADTLAELERWTDWVINQGYSGFCRVVIGDESGFEIIIGAIDRAYRLNHANVLAISHIFLSLSCWQAARYDEAVQYATDAIRVSQASGDQLALHLAYGIRAWAHTRMDNQDQAWLDFKEYERIVHALGGRLIYNDWFAAARAEILFNTGYLGEALKQAQEAVALAEAVDGIFAAGIAHRIWAQALFARAEGTAQEIELHLRRSLELLITSDAYFEMENTRRIWDGLSAL